MNWINNIERSMKCKTCSKNHNVVKTVMQYGNGGEIGSMIGSTVGTAANLIAPGLGSILSPILGSVGSMLGGKVDAKKSMRERLSQSTINTNPYGYENGGYITGKEDLAIYTGNSHSQGGIGITENGIPTYNPMAEVEGNETVLRIGKKSHIFSKKLKV